MVKMLTSFSRLDSKTLTGYTLLVILAYVLIHPLDGYCQNTYSPFSNGLEFHRKAGLLIGEGSLPFFADLYFTKGTDDSTRYMLNISFSNFYFQFLRQDGLFKAEYEIFITFKEGQGNSKVSSNNWVQEIEARNYGEANSKNESFIFQAYGQIPPGAYTVKLEARDSNLFSSFSSVEEKVIVPDFTEKNTRALISPLAIYFPTRSQIMSLEEGRRIDLVSNPKRLAKWGKAVVFYLELYFGYQVSRDYSLISEVYNGIAEPLVSSISKLHDLGSEQSAIVTLPTESLYPGTFNARFTIKDANGELAGTASMGFRVMESDGWLVKNFAKIIRYLEYIATPQEVKKLGTANEEVRLKLWREFWKERDPITATEENEFFLDYFKGIEYANDHFSNRGIEGWRTDKGKVVIFFGLPDKISQQGQYEIWIYPERELQFVFSGDTLQDNFELERAMEAVKRGT